MTLETLANEIEKISFEAWAALNNQVSDNLDYLEAVAADGGFTLTADNPECAKSNLPAGSVTVYLDNGKWSFQVAE